MDGPVAQEAHPVPNQMAQKSPMSVVYLMRSMHGALDIAVLQNPRCGPTADCTAIRVAFLRRLRFNSMKKASPRAQRRRHLTPLFPRPADYVMQDARGSRTRIPNETNASSRQLPRYAVIAATFRQATSESSGHQLEVAKLPSMQPLQYNKHKCIM